jgi:hypothetical protein
MNPDIINHIEDEIPEYELLKMLEEVQEEEYQKEVDAVLNGNSQEEILDIAKQQNRIAHHKGKTIRPKKTKGVAKVSPCTKATFDTTICKMCYRKFMDTNPLATAIFTEADFKIDAETLC